MKECTNCGGSGFSVGSIGYPCDLCNGTGEHENKVKTVFVLKNALITDGILKGMKGKVIGYDYPENEVTIELDEQTLVIVKSEIIEQNI